MGPEILLPEKSCTEMDLITGMCSLDRCSLIALQGNMSQFPPNGGEQETHTCLMEE